MSWWGVGSGRPREDVRREGSGQRRGPHAGRTEQRAEVRRKPEPYPTRSRPAGWRGEQISKGSDSKCGRSQTDTEDVCEVSEREPPHRPAQSWAPAGPTRKNMNGRSRREPLGYFSRQGQRSQEEISVTGGA